MSAILHEIIPIQATVYKRYLVVSLLFMRFSKFFLPSPFLYIMLQIALPVQYNISAKLNTDIPQKSPSVPPTLDMRSVVVMVAVRTISCAIFPLERRNSRIAML